MVLPSDLGVWSWIAADHITGLAASGPIASTPDLAQASSVYQNTDTTARPLWVPNTLGGLPVIRFDGVNDCLISTTSQGFGVQTAFAVHRPTATTNNGNIFGGIGVTAPGGSASQDGVNSFVLRTKNDNTYNIVQQGIQELGSSSVAVVANQWAIVSVDVTTNDAPPGLSHFFNAGGAVGSPTNGGSFTATGWTHAMMLGGSRQTSLYQEWYQGDIAEAFYFNRILTATERGQMHSYLAEKWQLTAPSDYVAVPATGPIVNSSALGAMTQYIY
jgi:hypothetical protein